MTPLHAVSRMKLNLNICDKTLKECLLLPAFICQFFLQILVLMLRKIHIDAQRRHRHYTHETWSLFHLVEAFTSTD